MDQLHVADIIEIYLILQHHNEPFAIESDIEDGSRECELADGRSSLIVPLNQRLFS